MFLAEELVGLKVWIIWPLQGRAQEGEVEETAQADGPWWPGCSAGGWGCHEV